MPSTRNSRRAQSRPAPYQRATREQHRGESTEYDDSTESELEDADSTLSDIPELLREDSDDLTDAETQETQEVINLASDEEPEHIPPATQILNQQLNRSDEAVYEEEYSPVEEVEEPPRASSPKHSRNQQALNETIDDKNSCVICCESFTTDGKHEIVVLTNCGHVFGRECIQNWIKTGKKECPNCKTKAQMKHILKIFPPCLPLNPIDNSENEQLRKQNTDLSKRITTLERDLRIEREKLGQANKMLKRKDDEIIHLRNNSALRATQATQRQSQDTGMISNIDNYEFQENINLKHIGFETINDPIRSKYSSRLLVCDAVTDPSVLALPVEQPQNLNALYPTMKYGLQILDARRRKKVKYIPVHKDDIKDISFGCGFLLTGSSDKTLRTVDINASKVVGVYQAPHRAWSVTWNRGKHLIYGGLQNGQVVEFDIRQNGKNPTRVFASGSPLPVMSIFYKNNGLLTLQSRLINWTPMDNGPPCALIGGNEGLPMPGSGVSLNYLQNDVLATFRPPQSSPETVIYKLSGSSNSGIRSFKVTESSRFIVGNRHEKIARDKLISYNNNTFAACSNQQGRNTKIFTMSGTHVQSLVENKFGAVLDIISYQIGNETFLAETNGKNVNFYKF